MDRALAEFSAAGGDAAQESVLSLGLARAFCSLLEEDHDRVRNELDEVLALEERRPTRYHLAGQDGLLLLLDELDGKPPRSRSAATGLRWNRQFERWAEAVRLGREGSVAEADAAAAEALAAAEIYPMARYLGFRLVAERAAEHGWGDPVTWLKDAEEYFHNKGITAVASACRGLLRGIGAPVQQRRAGLDRVPADLRRTPGQQGNRRPAAHLPANGRKARRQPDGEGPAPRPRGPGRLRRHPALVLR